MPFKPRPAPLRRSILIFSLAGALGSTACAHLAPLPAPLQAAIPPTLTQPCPRPAKDQVRTVGDLAAFSIDQEAAIGVCEAQRDEAVGLVRNQNAASAALHKALAPRPWWRVW